MNDKIAGKFKDSLTPYDKAELKDADEKLEKMFDIAQKEHVGLNISPLSVAQSILVATPMYGGMCTGHYTIALMNSINTLKSLKVETLLASDTPCKK